jgi:AbrB family looped-hinge helix DNA binding protein
MEKHIYNAEEIFEDIPGDPDNVIMNIPQEIRDKLGWKEGDTITVTLEEGSIVLEKK